MSSTIYVETSVFNYLTPPNASDLATATYHFITQQWWSGARRAHLKASYLLRIETAAGPPNTAHRFSALQSVTLLPASQSVQRLTNKLLASGLLPPESLHYAIHIATAAANGSSYFLTWDMDQLGSPPQTAQVNQLLEDAGYRPLSFCTPADLTGEQSAPQHSQPLNADLRAFRASHARSHGGHVEGIFRSIHHSQRSRDRPCFPAPRRPVAGRLKTVGLSPVLPGILIPLVSPLIAAAALIWAITHEANKFHAAQTIERESQIESVAAPAYYAHNVWKTVSATAKRNFVDRTWIAEYKHAAFRLCDAIQSEPAVTRLIYGEMVFPNILPQSASNGLVLLAQLCITSRGIGENTSPEAIRRIDANLSFFLATVLFFFEKDGCTRESLYRSIVRIRDENSGNSLYQYYLISTASSAYGEVTQCDR